MRTINVHAAKTHLSRILKEIEEGETHFICKNGKPIADLSRHVSKSRTKVDPLLSQIEIRYDPTEPLADDEWLLTPRSRRPGARP